MSAKNNNKHNKLDIDLLKNELVIARTSFELAKQYKELAQASKESNADESAILHFYAFASFSHLNHCLMSIRKIFFDTAKPTVMSLGRYFQDKMPNKKWNEGKEKFHKLSKKDEIKDDINKVIAHMNREKGANSIFSIPEQKFTDIEILLNETIELFNTLLETENSLLPEKYSAFPNVLFGFETLIALAKKGVENKHCKNSRK